MTIHAASVSLGVEHCALAASKTEGWVSSGTVPVGDVRATVAGLGPSAQRRPWTLSQ